MKVFVTLCAFVAAASALSLERSLAEPTVFGYLQDVGIPEAERIRKAEDEFIAKNGRIVGGEAAALGSNPWQAGLLISLVGLDGQAVCGASLVSATKLVTAAHCWFDGRNQAHTFTVVLGSLLLFTGGERIATSDVVTHPSWSPNLIRNDIAMITLPSPVAFSDIISPIALPSGSELSNAYTGQVARVSGFGLKADGAGVASNQFVSEVEVEVISNLSCMLTFLTVIQGSNICTSGAGGRGPCSGDSGGPLTVESNGRRILLGAVSFGSARGCELGLPAAYARITSFTDFIESNM